VNEPTPASLGDTPDWLPEQGQQRASAVPGFDPEETLSTLRAARDADAYAPSPARSRGEPLAATGEEPSPATDTKPLRLPDGPGHRTIVVLDVEESTQRGNPDKGELRRSLYGLTERALQAAGIAGKHLEPKADRGDGVMILIRPHDEVPKTLVLDRLIPVLTALLIEHNASVTRPQLRLRLRAVVHAGEIHKDANGFYGDDIDTAFRLLRAPGLKKALKQAAATPLILVVSEEIFHGIVEQGYLADALFRPLDRGVRVGRRERRGWVHVPVPLTPGRPQRAARRSAVPTGTAGKLPEVMAHYLDKPGCGPLPPGYRYSPAR